MRARHEQERLFGVLAISLAAHVFIFIGLGFAPSLSEAALTRAVEIEVMRPKPPEPKVNPAPATKEPVAKPKPEKPLPPPKAKQAQNAPEPPTPSDKSPTPPQQLAPVEFPGVTLTNESGDATWSTVVGNGSALKGPVVAPRKTPQRSATGPVGNPGSGGGARIPQVNLSRPPRPPSNEDALLAKHYPPRAKSQGIEGQAILRVRIKSDGLVADMSIVRETYPEFGKACIEHLKNTRWIPALDRFGRSIAFDLTYTCRFEVGY